MDTLPHLIFKAIQTVLPLFVEAETFKASSLTYGEMFYNIKNGCPALKTFLQSMINDDCIW
jgi:hypothetical protein